MMQDLWTNYELLRTDYLEQIAAGLECHLKDLLSDCERIDRITSRAKDTNRFVKKAQKTTSDGRPKYSDPLRQIQDQVGARVITFYLDDVQAISNRIRSYFRHVENQFIQPEKEKEFGYVGEHFILFLPLDVVPEAPEGVILPQFFELQVKTLFQHAWSEAEHDLGYKSPAPLSQLQKRKMAFTAAQSWGADQIFNELCNELNLAPSASAT